MTAPAVLAPAVAPTLGIAPDRVGLFVGLSYLAAMLSGLASGHWVSRIGAVQVSLVAMGACALGAFVSTAGLGWVLLGAAVLIGTGYGLINPAAANLLGRHAPPGNRGLFFSIKQSGVPVGVATGALMLPLGLAVVGWKASITALGVIACVTAIGLLPLRSTLDMQQASTSPTAPGKRRIMPLTVVADPAVRRLSFMSFGFALTQMCFLTFLVSLLHLELEFSLAMAGAALAGAQALSTVARITLGHVADRWIRPARLLGLLGLAMSAACIGLSVLNTSSAVGLVWLVALACGATAMGWNGVFFAELARHEGRADLATLAGGTQFFTFSGGMIGPVLVGEFISYGGSYSLAYALIAIAPALAGITMLRNSPPRSRAP